MDKATIAKMRKDGFNNEMDLVEKGYCPICERLIYPDELKTEGHKREFEATGLCRLCQDRQFGITPTPERIREDKAFMKIQNKRAVDRILNAKTPEELKWDLDPKNPHSLLEGDLMYKNIFVMQKHVYEKEIDDGKHSRRYIRTGLKCISKRNVPTNTVYAVFYFGDVDRFDNWWNKRNYQYLKGMPPAEFDKHMKGLIEHLEKMDGTAVESEVSITDYTKWNTIEEQFEQMKKNGGGIYEKLPVGAESCLNELKKKEDKGGRATGKNRIKGAEGEDNG